MRSAFVVLAAAGVLSLPAMSHATERDDYGYDDYDRDRHGDGYDHDRDERDRDRGKGHGGDRDYHDRYDDGGYGHGDGYDGGYDYDHGDKKCPESFDLVLSFIDYAADYDDDGVICCKLVHHGWKKVVVCVDRDEKDKHGRDGYDDYEHGSDYDY